MSVKRMRDIDHDGELERRTAEIRKLLDLAQFDPAQMAIVQAKIDALNKLAFTRFTNSVRSMLGANAPIIVPSAVQGVD